MVGQHHGLNGHESEQTPGDNEGQGSLACFSPWSCKESDIIGQLNNKGEIEKASTRLTLSCFQLVLIINVKLNRLIEHLSVTFFYPKEFDHPLSPYE